MKNSHSPAVWCFWDLAQWLRRTRVRISAQQFNYCHIHFIYTQWGIYGQEIEKR